MRRLLGFLLAIGLIVLLFVWLEGNDVTIASLRSADLSSTTVQVGILILIGVVLLMLLRENFSYALKSMLVWIAIALVLAVGYTYRFRLHEVADQVMAEFVPGHAATSGRSVMVARSPGGNFVVDTHVNKARVSMILDTGASSVVLTQTAAKAAGLPIEVLNYSVTIDTANGRARAAPVTLQSIAVGGLIERDVSALVAQPGQLRQSLLGMSFLNRLQGWEVRGDRLVLRAYP